ncbi:hypothetical protein BC939DRAFT_82666 [Gamsiella multidivaricata]|uniref:uncharacterized protein n=1 Tax=Gamsiella multidivaricata TaxID=101098 RepID=UPI0022205998|nr:uncharacterized protein BC939DRAFT_82666 [Gamsiella multidivaricata]KAI7815827.1 hypothetical protein BC939DRAFT_82666 [Gamsiella multidivaricata]
MPIRTVYKGLLPWLHPTSQPLYHTTHLQSRQILKHHSFGFNNSHSHEYRRTVTANDRQDHSYNAANGNVTTLTRHNTGIVSHGVRQTLYKVKNPNSTRPCLRPTTIRLQLSVALQMSHAHAQFDQTTDRQTNRLTGWLGCVWCTSWVDRPSIDDTLTL